MDPNTLLHMKEEKKTYRKERTQIKRCLQKYQDTVDIQDKYTRMIAIKQLTPSSNYINRVRSDILTMSYILESSLLWINDMEDHTRSQYTDSVGMHIDLWIIILMRKDPRSHKIIKLERMKKFTERQPINLMLKTMMTDLTINMINTMDRWSF